MIEFPCRCGRGFSVPEDQAGTSFQCPNCHLLVEVPLLSDLQNIDKDGMYKIDELEVKSDEKRIKELRRIYLAGHSGRDSEQIDLRSTDEDLQKAGVVEERSPEDGLIPAAPIYDPVTGELIEAIDIKPEPKKPMAAIPVDAEAPTLNYARKDAPIVAPLTFGTVLLALTKPGSLVTYAILIVMNYFWIGYLFLVLAAPLLLLMVLLPLMAAMMSIAFIPKLVEEFGPGEADELPGVFQGAEFVSDIWTPMIHLIIAFALSYFPLAFIHNEILARIWVVFGTFVFPAMLLTSCCSGILADLRPDRLIKVIQICGWKYLVSVALWAATFFGFGQVALNCVYMAVASNWTPLLKINPLLLGPGLILPILFAIHLASFYRQHYAEFPWVFQDQIVRMKRAERSKRRRSKKIQYERESPQAGPAVPRQ